MDHLVFHCTVLYVHLTQSKPFWLHYLPIPSFIFWKYVAQLDTVKQFLRLILHHFLYYETCMSSKGFEP